MKPLYVLLILLLASVATNHAMAKHRQQTDTTKKANPNEVPASFRGGIDGWRRYLEGNLQYPKKAVKKQTQGVVRVEMTVDAKGNVTNVKAQNDPGNGLAAEAVRVVKDGPRWIPATQDGKPVTFRMIQMITFALQ